MKRFLKRALSLTLCALFVLALFPVTSEAFTDAYTTMTYLKDKDEHSTLKLPGKCNYFFAQDKLPKRAEVKASWEGGGIYFMPRAELGHGTLGIVEDGTPVTILARQNGLYFFMTDDGRMGWNGGTLFTKPQTISEDLSEPLENSELTGEIVKDISEYLRGHRYAGSYTWMYYADCPVLILKSGESTELTVHSYFCKAKYKAICEEGTSAEVDWDGKFSRNCSTVDITAKEPGMTVLKFTSNANKGYFNVLVYVI